MTIVQVSEADGEKWKEVTKVNSVSRNGAGFTLKRPCTVGRLVKLAMPLAHELRAYDHDKDLYPVIGIVQYCNAAEVDGETVYHTGVGLVGKNIPPSYRSDPTQNFRIAGMGADGLWKITEADFQFKQRRQARHWLSLPITVSLMQKGPRSAGTLKNERAKQETVTINVAGGGVAVVCSLEAERGDKVKIACPPLDFYAIAVVRNRRFRDDEMPSLHLELVDAKFPVDMALSMPVRMAGKVPAPELAAA